jgi:hypothetical protein
VRIAKQLKPAIDVLKARPSRAFKTSMLDFYLIQNPKDSANRKPSLAKTSATAVGNSVYLSAGQKITLSKPQRADGLHSSALWGFIVFLSPSLFISSLA